MIEHARVLKHGDTFAVFDSFGDIESSRSPELGLYHRDTRFCSRFKLRIEGELSLLSSTISEDNALLSVELANSGPKSGGEVGIPAGTILISRRKFLWNSTSHERLQIRNSGREPINFSFQVEFDSDYADLFEVRGIQRKQRGRRFPCETKAEEVEFVYEGLDRQRRRTSIRFDPIPTELTESRAGYAIQLEPRGEAIYDFQVHCSPGSATLLGYDEAAKESVLAIRAAKAAGPEISTANKSLNDWLSRSRADLATMLTHTPYGPYPYAGIPWYNTAFGRDGIITALECLWFDPEIARGVLSYLAATQADEENPERDAQPGKILHETRGCEMAILGEVPFDRYYGSIDSTPLFVMLAGSYYERTGDTDLIRSIWPNIERALNWIDSFGDLDGDGFVEYERSSSRGLRNQGWKDSDNSIFHQDGTSAEGAIALCEVQAYVYAAKLAAAGLAKATQKELFAEKLVRQAETLRHHFHETFWCEELSTYVLALDGQKKPCRVRSSNAGHCLFAGIASDEQARRIATVLTGDELFSGWGIRTVASSETSYDPRSYHNGSIWPHDNALIAAGFARYGLKREAAKIFRGLFEATGFFELRRLPELFCGFLRTSDEGPAPYPVSCSPQTWAACAVFLLLDACLGLKINAPERKMVFTNPYLPEFLPEMKINRLRVGDATVDLAIAGDESNVAVDVLYRDGRVEVAVLE